MLVYNHCFDVSFDLEMSKYVHRLFTYLWFWLVCAVWGAFSRPRGGVMSHAGNLSLDLLAGAASEARRHARRASASKAT